jgi:alpha-glucosidase
VSEYKRSSPPSSSPRTAPSRCVTARRSAFWRPQSCSGRPPTSRLPDPEPEQPKPDPNVYGAFKPYVPPAPTAAPKPPGAPPDPDTLPGFSTAAPAQPTVSSVNVATEANDPTSLLNFYRRLAQLHHGNSSLRDGRTYTFDHDTEDALVWLRRAPAGARTAANVLIVCNLGDRPVALSLADDLARLHIRSGTLRPLLASWSATPITQRTEHILLPPYSVYIGELYH